MAGGLRFVALALGFALLFAAAGHLLLTMVLKAEANIWVSALTALIVGTFVALQMVARQNRRAPPAAEEEGAGGFEVTSRK
jgi:hypothetical protein